MKPAITKSFLTRSIGLYPNNAYSIEARKKNENLDKQKPKHRRKSNRSLRKTLLEDDPYCYYCGIPLTLDGSTLDHAIPLSKGGTDEFAVLACYPCNQDKGDKIVIPWHLNRGK